MSYTSILAGMTTSGCMLACETDLSSLVGVHGFVSVDTAFAYLTRRILRTWLRAQSNGSVKAEVMDKFMYSRFEERGLNGVVQK